MRGNNESLFCFENGIWMVQNQGAGFEAGWKKVVAFGVEFDSESNALFEIFLVYQLGLLWLKLCSDVLGGFGESHHNVLSYRS